MRTFRTVVTREPVMVAALVAAMLVYGLQLIVDAGLDTSGVAAGVIPILAAFVARLRVTPVADPRLD